MSYHPLHSSAGSQSGRGGGQGQYADGYGGQSSGGYRNPTNGTAYAGSGGSIPVWTGHGGGLDGNGYAPVVGVNPAMGYDASVNPAMGYGAQQNPYLYSQTLSGAAAQYQQYSAQYQRQPNPRAPASFSAAAQTFQPSGSSSFDQQGDNYMAGHMYGQQGSQFGNNPQYYIPRSASSDGAGSVGSTIVRSLSSTSASGGSQPAGTGGSNSQGRALNKMLLDILRDRVIHPGRLAAALDANIERFDCVNLATLLFHTGKKRLILIPAFIERIAARFCELREELRAREASNALYGLRCMSSECSEVRLLVRALAMKLQSTSTKLVAQAVGNAIYGLQVSS